MRSLIYLYFALLASSKLIAGDTPCGATLLGTDDPMFITFDNTATSNSGIAPPPYGGYFGPDTWISFIMPSGGFYLVLNGMTLIDPAIAIYEGLCTDPKLLYNVLDNNCDSDPNPLLFIDQLTPGQQYFIRVWAQDGSPNGIFEIKLLQTISGIPDFIAFADATIVGDCIELTQNTGGQQGCAWFQNPIDFTMPFSHEMTANFGTTDANGADGICLVYQSNGQDFCGGTGEGIGAGGMPNSAIFEFDTWQNGNLNDPVQDHCAFNINGDMNHINSIEGPILLGNIEDGLDHSIVFEWESAGNLYSLYFDGALVLSGSFDIINNCFGGSTTAFWGYTSATGGSNNLHVICPVVEIFQPSYTEYNEVDICEGESFLGHFEPGFYVDFIPGANGCQYQFNTLLNVHEIPEPNYLFEVVCEGEFILVADDVFTLPNLYEINTYNEFGCDSTIYLQLDNIIPNIEVEIPPLITCINSSVQLIPNPSSNYDITNVNYTWSGNQITTNQDILQVTEPGTYFLTALITSNGMQCLAFTNVTVEIDTTSPILQNLSDVFLDCSNIATDTILSVSGLGDNVESSWIFEDSIISQINIANIISEGIYTVIATDTTNGCQVKDSLLVTLSNDIPVIDLFSDDLNCQITTLQPYFTTTGIIDTFLWTHNNQLFSYDSIPTINQAGTYNIKVISKDGCESSASIDIKIDTIKPIVELQDIVIPCDILWTNITPLIEPDMTVEWTGPNMNVDSSISITITEDGWYHLTVTNPNNFCSTLDSSFIQFKGSSPTLSLEGDSLNCNSLSTIINLISDQTDLSFEWTSQNGFYNDSEDPQVNEEGWYHINATNQNGCLTNDSIYIFSNFEYPSIDVTFDTLNCVTTSALIDADISNGDIISWTGPNSFQSEEASFSTSLSGIFFLNVINESSGCQSFDTINIINTAIMPEFEIDTDTLTCLQNDLALPFSLSTPYLNLLWSGPSGFSSDSINPRISEEGEYFIHIDFEGECTLDTSLFIALNNESPTYSVDYDSITCTSPLVTFNTIIDNEMSTFSLTSPSGETTSMSEFNSNEAGTYFLSIEGMNGCLAMDTFLVASYLEIPEITITEYDSITCSNSVVDIVTTTNETNLIYNWIGPAGFISDMSTFSTSQDGIYNLIVTNEYGCQEQLEILIESFLDRPEIELDGDNIYCDQPASTILYNSSDQNLKVSWNSTESFIDMIDSISVDQAGWYVVLAENEYGCISNDSIFIEAFIETPDLILLTEDTIVVNVDDPNTQILIEVISDTDFDLDWFPEIGLSCYSCLDPIINSLDHNIYEVVVTNEYGCSISKTVYIRYQQDLKIHIPNVFSPGTNDGINDFFTIYGNDNIALVNSMKIFDRWGEMVALKNNFEPNIPSLGWDGIVSGRIGTSAVYVYSIQITTTSGEIINFYGDLTLL